MANYPVITGVGILAAIGQGKEAFAAGMLEGRSAFRVMQRPGRQMDSSYLGAELTDFTLPASVSRQTERAASFSALAALTVLDEAWMEAQLSEVDPRRIGLIIGGSNVQQRDLIQAHDKNRERPQFLRPTYALSFLDSDLCGFCTAQFGIRGFAYTTGGASASGQLAIMQAAQMVASGQVDACVALGALTDLSYWECQGLRSIGAMGSDRFADQPALACRPFDHDHDGFIFGECCGAVVVESAESNARRRPVPYAELRGWGMVMDGNRNPDPSLEGEKEAIKCALDMAGCRPEEIDYVNPHGTGSIVGDQTELQALSECGLATARINATKSLIGHGLSAAGTVEVIATLLQMRAGRLHPTRNLDNPIDLKFRWVRGVAVDHLVENALTLSMGFGGVNTALCWHLQH
ncbi:MAG: beta-ketoacyl synthase N-terminal-like domain-containing protein [Terracidiphilus sp.]|jgi:malonyl-ACP decarboxylase